MLPEEKGPGYDLLPLKLRIVIRVIIWLVQILNKMLKPWGYSPIFHIVDRNELFSMVNQQDLSEYEDFEEYFNDDEDPEEGPLQ